MLFNSLPFLLFLPIVYFVYWRLKHKIQNRWLLLASYFFYGCWDWRFLGLIATSTVLDFICAQRIADNTQQSKKKLWLLLSLGFNLGMLGIFKYYNFFIDNLQELGSSIGWNFDSLTLNILLPVGISFYTFQTLSYTLDVYYGTLKPSKSLEDFALFVSFFPQLVAGPIERARNFLPQVTSPRAFDIEQFRQGVWLICWGMYKKIFIADNCAKIANEIFNGNSADYTGIQVLVGVYAFAWQIFGDFSGYSDIARGIAKILGFELMLNFKTPYFSKNLSEFWRRWHISLSTWLNDYIYNPVAMALRYHGTKGIIIATFITFLLSGVWHGAGWNFIFWGLLHVLGLIFFILTKKPRKRWKKRFPKKPYLIFCQIVTFHYVCLAYIFFRANSLEQGFSLVSRFSEFGNWALVQKDVIKLFGFVSFLFFMQVLKNHYKDTLFILQKNVKWRILVYLIVLFCLLRLSAIEGQEFIYFQF